MRPRALLLWILCPASVLLCQGTDAGKRTYENQCAHCHGGDGNGGEFAPAIVNRLPSRNDDELAALIRAGLPNRGMPAFDLSAREIRALVEFLRVLRPPRLGDPAMPVPVKIETVDGRALEGLAVNRSSSEMQLRAADGRIHLLRRVGDRYREVTSQADWPSYNGQLSGNRHTPLRQIDKTNVARLAPRWIFPFPETSPLEGTPVVVEGVMIWHYQRPRTQRLSGNALSGVNRGVGVAGDRLYMVTDNAHLIALNRFTGALLWDTEMADSRQNYSATGAPLAIGALVISGIAGGDAGARGFLSAFDQASGKEVWRFWTVPLRGEPGSETWKGKTIEHPGSATWMTGAYDPQLDLLYWPTGNPGSDLNGDEREGDNLYSDSIVALDAKTGKLKWYYQFTPHDLWDWDAQQPPVLVDADWQGQPRKLMLHADRNGFFYVLDRTDGKLLLAKPFVQRLTWAREIGPDGRPVKNPGQDPSPEGTRVCPSLIGATNWWSTSFNPATGLYYVQTLESCAIFVKRTMEWEAGKGFNGGTTRQAPDDVPQKFLRAIDIKTGKIAWELPETGPGTTRGGALSTASGLVFFCDDSDALTAADAASGAALWSFPVNHFWRASPMTYVFDGKQYIAVASGQSIIAFGLVE